jgi:hypothetical protein
MENEATHPNDLHANGSTLMVFSPTPQDRTFQLQMEMLDYRRNVLQGLDVVVAQIFEDRRGQIGSDTLPEDGCDGLRRLFHVPSGRFRVMLVDKDSHIKMVADSCVSFEEVVMRVENEPNHLEMSL